MRAAHGNLVVFLFCITSVSHAAPVHEIALSSRLVSARNGAEGHFSLQARLLRFYYSAPGIIQVQLMTQTGCTTGLSEIACAVDLAFNGADLQLQGAAGAQRPGQCMSHGAHNLTADVSGGSGGSGGAARHMACTQLWSVNVHACGDCNRTVDLVSRVRNAATWQLALHISDNIGYVPGVAATYDRGVDFTTRQKLRYSLHGAPGVPSGFVPEIVAVFACFDRAAYSANYPDVSACGAGHAGRVRLTDHAPRAAAAAAPAGAPRLFTQALALLNSSQAVAISLEKLGYIFNVSSWRAVDPLVLRVEYVMRSAAGFVLHSPLFADILHARVTCAAAAECAAAAGNVQAMFARARETEAAAEKNTARLAHSAFAPALYYQYPWVDWDMPCNSSVAYDDGDTVVVVETFRRRRDDADAAWNWWFLLIIIPAVLLTMLCCIWMCSGELVSTRLSRKTWVEQRYKPVPQHPYTHQYTHQEFVPLAQTMYTNAR